jgi:hypothetical protein
MEVQSIAEQLFFTTVRVDTITAAGASGAGTAFLYAHKRGEMTYPFVVTNKHVVSGMREGALTFSTRADLKPALGKGFRLQIQDWNQAWFGHPDGGVDIAICPFAPLEQHIKTAHGLDLFYRFVSTEMVPTAESLAKLDALEMVTFVGYPNGVWDRQNLLPVARKGHAASPLDVDFEGTPCFLIDASVFGGSSGSPVFIANQGMYSDKLGPTVLGSRLIFLGVIAAVYYRTQFNKVVPAPIPTQFDSLVQNQEMIDLGIVFKARTVVETVEAFLKEKQIA